MFKSQNEIHFLNLFGGFIDEYFHSEIVGVGYSQDRVAQLNTCKLFELLNLDLASADLILDNGSVSVLKPSGELLGYLPNGVATSFAPRLREGTTWLAILLDLKRSLLRKRVVGAKIMCIRIDNDVLNNQRAILEGVLATECRDLSDSAGLNG